ncbi:MAG: hypothetical protein OEY49_09850, partial [Candidatus Heimdallarchaeota archaeon]|nr:hypothetical protein [Candidatus Heimdallarchaeota archaeon]
MVLFAQNIIWFIGSFVGDGVLYNILLYIDLIGFLLMGIGYIMTANNGGSQNYLYGGLGFIGWVVCRVLWQFILVEDLVTSGSIGDVSGFVDTFFEMVWAFFISAICLLIGTIFIMQQKT